MEPTQSLEEMLKQYEDESPRDYADRKELWSIGIATVYLDCVLVFHFWICLPPGTNKRVTVFFGAVVQV